MLRAIGSYHVRYFASQPQNSPAPTPNLEGSTNQLSDNLPAVEATESIPIENLASLSETAPELQVEITKHLGISDLLRLGTVNKTLNDVMSRRLADYAPGISVPQTLTAAMIATLSKVKNLHLVVSHPTIENMQLISQLTNLHTLNLSGTDARDDHLHPFRGGLSNLRALHLDETLITDIGMQYLRGMINLQLLELSGTAVTDLGLQFLKALNNLKTLYLGWTKLTDTGLENLQAMDHLEMLDLTKTQVTDLGLQSLYVLTKLKTLILIQTNVTDLELENLKTLIPLQALILSWEDLQKAFS
jgi:hypothetical protein